jgi:hypothetical protein
MNDAARDKSLLIAARPPQERSANASPRIDQCGDHARRVRLPETYVNPPTKRLPHRMPHAPLIFADTADIEAIRSLRDAGIISA